MMIPNGAQKIIDARKAGMKPAEMLIISLAGKVDEVNYTIYANPKAEYDWRWLVGLSVCIYTKQNIDWRPLAMAVARANPEALSVYDQDQYKGAEVSALPLVSDIEKPKSQWRYSLHVLPWLEFQNNQFAWGA